MMKILILFLIYPLSGASYSPEKLEKERQSLLAPIELPSVKKSSNPRFTRKKLEISKSPKDLEAIYFDEVRTNAAAPKKLERKKRVR